LSDSNQTNSYEIVTVLVRKADYAKLKRSGVPSANQITMALRYYLRLLEDTRLVSGAAGSDLFNGAASTFRCALPRELCGRVRSLGGRFDLHAMEAVRLWLI
jgi:hypothetical protein